jgi:hypothetical protein
VVNWVSSPLSFFLRASAAATYIFTAPNCTTIIISLEPCALNAEYQDFVLSCSISYWDLLKCLDFADTTERGDRGLKGGPKNRVKTGLLCEYNSFLSCESWSQHFGFAKCRWESWISLFWSTLIQIESMWIFR